MSGDLFTRKYWIDVLERVVSTVGEVGAAALTFDGVSDLHFEPAHYALLLGLTALATVMKCLAALKVGADNTAALLPAGPDTEKGAVSLVTLLVIVLLVVLLLAATGNL